MAITVHTPVSRHFYLYVMGAVAAVALVVSVLVGLAVADSDSSPATGASTGSVKTESVHDAPSSFDGSPDAIERRGTSDPARYGSPDAAEEWNR